MEIFPNYFIRSGGIPFVFSTVKNSELIENINAFIRTKQDLAKKEIIIIDKLSLLVGKVKNVSLKRKIINLKRNLYNHRAINNSIELT